MNNVIIMRGLPGSGKTTFADKLADPLSETNKMIVSADHYHTINGIYCYDPKKAGMAHAKCLMKFTNALLGWYTDFDTVIVDNTNCSAWEIAPYYQLATAFDVPNIRIVQMCCDLQTAMSRQTHNVPESTIFAMHQTINNERLPPRWKIEFQHGEKQ